MTDTHSDICWDTGTSKLRHAGILVHSNLDMLGHWYIHIQTCWDTGTFTLRQAGTFKLSPIYPFCIHRPLFCSDFCFVVEKKLLHIFLSNEDSAIFQLFLTTNYERIKMLPNMSANLINFTRVI